MITFFTTAKPFYGHAGVIQKNALRSWKKLHAGVEVLLFGDEDGAAEAAAEIGARHLPEVRRSGGGAKYLAPFFDAAQRMARHEVVCYANCDIVLPEEFLHAVNAADAMHQRFLMVGRRGDTGVTAPIEFERTGWKAELREAAQKQARRQSGDWIDYFVFRKGFYLGKIPEMVVGRVHWDQWLVWKAQEMGAAVVDATEEVMAIHQNHDYGYHPRGKAGVWEDELSRRNFELAGGRWHLRTIDDATHVLGPDGLRENPARGKRRAGRVCRTVKDAVWSAAMDWTRPVRRVMWQKVR